MNKIFRMLLMTVALVMSGANVQADEVTLWNDGPSSSFNVTVSSIAEGTLRVYTVSGQSLYVGTGETEVDGEPLFYTEWNTWIRKGEYYNDTKQCFEFPLTSEMVTKIQSDGLHIQNYSGDITRVTLETGEISGEGSESGSGEGSETPTQTYKLVFFIDNVQFSEEQVEAGTTIIPPTGDPQPGYKVKWNSYPSVMPSQDTYITGATVAIYTLTLDYNQEQGTVIPSKTSDIERYDQVTLEVTPADGYSIGEVTYTAADGSTPNNWIDGTYYVQFGNSDVTCHVTFVDASVITYNVWNGTVTGGNVTASPQQASAGQEVTLTLAPQSGYVLESISVSDGQNNIALSEDYKFTMPAGNVWVNATFVDQSSLLPKHTLTIDIDGNQTQMEVVEGTALSSVLPHPTKPGFILSGWTNMPADGNMPAEDLTLVAVFSETTYTLTFMLDNAVFGTPQQKKAGDPITAPTGIPVEDGYTFGGWQNMPSTMPAQNLTIYGYHVKNTETVTLSVGNSGFNTYYGDKPLYFNGTEAVKAYVAYAIGTSQVNMRQVIGAVAANTPMVLKGDAANSTASFNVVGTGETFTGNLLRGVTAVTEINDFTKYVLVEIVADNGTKTVKFADTGNRAASVPANKAYLQAPATAGSRQLTIVFENDLTNAIEAVSSESGEAPSVFNLSGQQVKNPGKGLYIINGKKVIIK